MSAEQLTRPLREGQGSQSRESESAQHGEHCYLTLILFDSLCRYLAW